MSITEIYNMALSHLGVGEDAGSATNEDSEWVRTLNSFKLTSLNYLKRKHTFQAFNAYETLTLYANEPNDHWIYAYTYPLDCLFFQRVLSSVRNEGDKQKIPYERGIMKDVEKKPVKVIFTDKESACGLFTEDFSDVNAVFDPDFAMAYSYHLAYLAAPRLTGGDPFQLQRSMLANFNLMFDEAVKADRLERQLDDYPPSKYELARRGRRFRTISGDKSETFPNNSVIS
jgi:hypothetical protein